MTRLLPLLLIVLVLPRPSAACSCVESGAACEDYWKASAVFLGRVESIARQTVKSPSQMPLRRVVTMTVIEAFSGVQKGTVEVTTGSGGGDCGFAFREGADYVVYAQRSASGGGLTVSLCSRTREVSRAGDDLQYARAIASGAPIRARVSGDVVLATRSLSHRPVPEPRPLPNVAVRLERDGQSTRVMTGADGRFSAEGLMAGRYTARLELSEGLYAEMWPKTIDLRDDRSCAEVHATAYPDGRVTGRVIDATGRPVVGLTMELTVAVGLDDPLGPERLRDLTDSDGRYEIAHAPAGRFIVGINTQRSRDGGLPEPRLFYPGVSSLTSATGVTLKAGERVALRDFVLPRDIVVVPVSGIVLDSAGRPAANALVYLKGQAEADYILTEPAVTDASGRFTLAAIAGRSYRLFAERSRDDAPSVRIDSSEQISFTATPGVAPFKLLLRARY
jgi:5-hydroxyisourate hydrolase-like protein (transthyretin family)